MARSNDHFENQKRLEKVAEADLCESLRSLRLGLPQRTRRNTRRVPQR